jgi:uncharacterized protein YjbI with pentapeptide repeats
MQRTLTEDKTLENIDFTQRDLTPGDYENCVFLNCNFSETDLSNINFTECKFAGCNLSMAKLAHAAFRDVAFKDCKLLGLHFENCNPFLFTVQFDNCLLNLSSFYRLKIKKTHFKNSSLHEVDFTETDLSASRFENCDMANAVFENTVLEKADLRTSYNYSIDPELNHIKKAKFSREGVIGLLNKYDIEIE